MSARQHLLTLIPPALGWDAAVAATLATLAIVYGVGTRRLWRNAGRGHGLGAVHVAAFAGALLTLVVALLSPLAVLKDALFSAHMGQHELLMLMAAPLLVMGKPWLAVAWALPERGRSRALALFAARAARGPWRTLTAPATILVLHGLALWIWHVPWLFQRAMENETVHAFQHLCFFVTAALFWWALVRGRYGRAGYGAAALFVFITALHSGMLGALLTFTGQLWYPLYGPRTRAVGRDPFEDQQLAGLLMWIPAGVVFTVLGVALLAAWLGEAERRGRGVPLR